MTQGEGTPLGRDSEAGDGPQTAPASTRETEAVELGGYGPGVFDLRVFDQAEYWVDEHAQRHRVASMSRAERRRLRGWLRTNADFFYAQVLRSSLAKMVLEESVPDPAPDLAGAREVLPGVVFASSLSWLRATPLFRALRRPGV
jgi:hypothetical protein